MILGFGKPHEELAFDVAKRLALAALGSPPVTHRITDHCSIDYWHRSKAMDAELRRIRDEHPDDGIHANIMVRDDESVLVHLSYLHVRHDHPLSEDGVAALSMRVAGWAYKFCDETLAGAGYSEEAAS